MNEVFFASLKCFKRSWIPFRFQGRTIEKNNGNAGSSRACRGGDKCTNYTGNKYVLYIAHCTVSFYIHIISREPSEFTLV